MVVNLSEGEPASAKDTALALTRPHLVLDGVVATARALGAREVHVVLPGERPVAAAAMKRRSPSARDGVDIVRARPPAPRFVAGQAKAVVELLSGRPNLPVTVVGPRGGRRATGAGRRCCPTPRPGPSVGLLVLRGAAAYTAHRHRARSPAPPC